ncbi:ankyrin repeat-containing domain protein [Phaeosphaeria sp. MPI-PUGE-AT-0046c]|nr:ankyrin repeat-containing domain protein [Phaeosphaeria sp. MPI-PUGE-AT-0046c]
MEPLSIVGLASSIVQLADASFKIMKVLDTIKGGKDRRKLCDEITVLWMVLRNLETQFTPSNVAPDESWMRPVDTLAEPNGVFAQLQIALEEVYKKVTTSDSSRGKLKQTLRWPLDQSYVDRVVGRIERLKSSILLVTNQASIAVAREMRSNITATQGTGGWFFTSKPFTAWIHGNDRWLWCHGIPGVGKTFLASSTVTELQRMHMSDHALVLVLFCSYDTVDSQSVENLVASLLKQVVQSRKSVPHKLQEKFKEHSAAGTKPKLAEVLEILNGNRSVPLFWTSYIISKEDPRSWLRRGRSRAYQAVSAPLEYYVTDAAKTLPRSITTARTVMTLIIAKTADKTYHLTHIHSPRGIDLNRIIGGNHDLQDSILSQIIDNAKDMFLLARFHMDALADCLTIVDIEHALGSLPQGINDTYEQALERISKLSVNRRRAVMRLLQRVSYSKRPLTIAELEHAIAISRDAQELRKDHIISAKVLTSLSAGIVIVDENERVRLTHKTAEEYFISRRTLLFPDGDVEITESCLAYLQLLMFESGPCDNTSKMAFDTRLEDYPFYGYARLFWADHARNCDAQIISPQALLFLRKKSLLEASVQALWYVDTESDDSWDVAGDIDALHLASYFGLNHVVTQLLDEGVDPNVRDSLATTPLIYACARRHAEVIETLLKAGALAHLIDHRDSTALLGTVKHHRLQLTRRILQENDVAINALYKAFNNYTALMLATWNSDPETVRMLLERHEVDVNTAIPGSGTNCLLLAACDDETACVNELLKHPKIDVNHQDNSMYTATHYAALYGYVDTLSLILDAGANTELQDDQGGRALQRAIDYGYLDTVKLLLEHGADYTFRDMLGRNILHAAAINGQVLTLRYLLETCKNLDVDIQGSQGETALHDAARHGYIATVNVLLKFGARSDIRNKARFTPVRLAQEEGWTDVLEVLRKAREQESKPDPTPEMGSIRKADTFGRAPETSLATAVEFESLKALQTRITRATLQELNAATRGFDMNALHCACEASRLEVVELLLDAGAVVDPIDSFSRTPLILACQKGDIDIVKALVKHGADVNHQFGTSPPWEIAWARRWTRTALFLLAQPQVKVDSDSRLIFPALGWAAALGELKASQKLVEAGAPLHLKNADGFTPSQIARNWEQDEVESYLIKEETKRRMASKEALANEEPVERTVTIENSRDVMQPPPAQPPAKEKDMVSQPPELLDNINDAPLKHKLEAPDSRPRSNCRISACRFMFVRELLTDPGALWNVAGGAG